MVNLPLPFTSFVATVASFSSNCLQTDPLDLGALDHGSHEARLGHGCSSLHGSCLHGWGLRTRSHRANLGKKQK